MATANEDIDVELDGVDPLAVEVEDDTPEEDRGRAPMPKEIVEELEADELEEYSDKVKTRLKQMKKVWHDERREKERISREQQESVSFTQRLLEENKRLKSTLSHGEQSLVSSYKSAAELEASAARKAYKEAYEAGDSDKIIEAQESLTAATYRLQQLQGYRPTLQEESTSVEQYQEQPSAPQLDAKTRAWQERNTWWGVDEEMTASALGLHQKLTKQNGANYVGTDEYWKAIDTTMRRRFPEYYGDGEEVPTEPTKPTRTGTRASTVVAPATRSTSAKTVKLRQSQIDLARRMGVTPEQYAREVMKLER
ncbi:hypothetical protein UFOVP1288_67 [uncultured Caudovirales phage]|uniref:Uncharacterized protein n=1 Tax=uncultured Caudovirales phage TaxID=2100421 RepID=A0A6J5S8D5_9CAUD|nr:hypothetical protein UFOVP1195_67 [uncultured Caudovirales phage]CAB4196208.1 hypothetical protein UFOVP1288_67 [uncultured Caudovirales phage]CAB4205177.1 hypothetical protein UFOVP1409_67 [uncultured Caudovirales phage]